MAEKIKSLDQINRETLEKLDKTEQMVDGEKKRKLIETLSVKQRLMRRHVKRVLQIQFSDDLGMFIVKCRRFKESEHKALLKLRSELDAVKTDVDYDAVMLQLFKLLAYPTGICLQKEFNLKFWTDGNYSADFHAMIIDRVVAITNKLVTDTRFLRLAT